jgi:hypothetical protein
LAGNLVSLLTVALALMFPISLTAQVGRTEQRVSVPLSEGDSFFRELFRSHAKLGSKDESLASSGWEVAYNIWCYRNQQISLQCTDSSGTFNFATIDADREERWMSRWSGLKQEGEVSSGSIAGSTQVSRSNLLDTSAAGNSGFSTNSRVD